MILTLSMNAYIYREIFRSTIDIVIYSIKIEVTTSIHVWFFLNGFFLENHVSFIFI